MTDPDARTALDTAVAQLRTLLADIGPDDLGRPVPCTEWTLADLVDHVVHGLGNFAAMVRGEQVDWTQSPTPVAADPVPAFDAAVAELRAAEEHPSGGADPDMQSAELAVHTWDLSRGLGRDTAGLDPTVAERGLAFMKANLKDEMRGEAFGPEQPAPHGADAYGRIAAFAGRSV